LDGKRREIIAEQRTIEPPAAVNRQYVSSPFFGQQLPDEVIVTGDRHSARVPGKAAQSPELVEQQTTYKRRRTEPVA
jgi:hypothetical protein